MTQATEQDLIRREEEVKVTLAAIKTIVVALGQRAMTMIALIAGIGAFAWAVYEPTAIRIAAVVLYSALIFLPLAVIDARRS